MRRFPVALLSAALLAACTGTPGTQTGSGSVSNTSQGAGMFLTIEQLTEQAEAGNIEAQFNLGAAYQDGDEVEKNLDEARKWLTMAADRGHALAAFNLGVMYYNAEGVTKDLEKAKKYFQISSDAGDAMAQFNLGVMAYRGEAMPQDYKLAFELFNKSATQGMPDAAFNLAVMYVRGEFVSKSDVTGLAWFKIAEDLGDDKAPAAVEAGYADIPEDMVAEVEYAYQQIKAKMINLAKNK